MSLWVAGLFPEFDRQGPVRDFWWRDMEIGANYTLDIDLAVSEDKKGCNRQVLIGGGGEPLAGGFIPLHFPSPNAGLRGWTQTTTGYPLVFTKTYTDYTMALPEGAGTLTENATYTLTISRASAQ